MTDDDAAAVAGILLLVLDAVTVAGRFYSRWASKSGFGWDDWTILIAMLSAILVGALTFWASDVSKNGAAANSGLIDPNLDFTPDIVKYTKITFSTTVLYFFIASTIKISLLLLLHRIFAISRSFKLQIYAVAGAVIAWWISATVADVCNCIPLNWMWKNAAADPKYCINYNYYWLFTGICESLLDLAILALPLTMVSQLHLDRKKKYGVASIFLVGGFVLFSGVVKVVLSYIPNSREPNFGRAALWTTIHLYTGILCANLPACRPLFNRVARLGTGSWIRLSSIGKRWYTMSGGKSFVDSDILPRSNSGSKSRDSNQSAGIEISRDDHELIKYKRDSQVVGDVAKVVVVEHAPVP